MVTLTRKIGKINKRNFRRISNFTYSGYKKDPVDGKRLSDTFNNENLTNVDDSQNKNLKALEDRSKNIFRLGCGATIDPNSCFEDKLTYRFKLSDKEEINERIEEIISFNDHQIKTDIDFTEFLSEGICIKQLQKLFKMEVEEDKTVIKVNNPWIQIILGIFIMTKDFILYNNLFNLKDKKKGDKIAILFDPYWNFKTSKNMFNIKSDSNEFKKLLFNIKQKSQVKRIQIF